MNSSFKTLLVAAASTLALAACGGSAEVASPGEGDFGNGGGNPGGPGTPGTGQAAADCPTGFANVGTIANGTLRNCQLPQQINGSLTVPLRAGTIYSISGRTAVGTDGGVDASANAGTQGILTVEPGVTIFASGGGDYPLVNRGSQIYAAGTASPAITPGVPISTSGGGDYLLVTRDSQIYAEGTAAQPTIFTSRQNVEGTTPETSQGQWGGIVIAGRAPQANCQLTAPVTCTGQVE